MNKHKSLFLVVLVTFCLCSVDFLSRFLTTEKSTVADSLNINASEDSTRFLRANDEVKIKALLATFDVVDVKLPKQTKKPMVINKPKINLMSKTLQQQQKGILASLFDGEDKYTLVATFDDSHKKFALISKMHLLSGKTSQIRLYEGDKISDYSLSKVSHDFVEFSLGVRLIKLPLFSLTPNKV